MPERPRPSRLRAIKGLGLYGAIALTTLVGFVPAASGTVITVNTTADEFNAGGNCSLREAVEAANNVPGTGCPTGQAGAFDPDFIDVPANTYTLTRLGSDDTNSAGDLDFTDRNVTLRNVGGGQTTVDPAAGERGFDVVGAAFEVAITGIRVTGGAPSGNGGAIHNNLNGATLTLSNVTLDGNNASGGGSGGAIFSGAGTTLALNNVTMSGNSAEGSGGALAYNSANNSFVENGTIINNTADTDESGDDGGGIRNNDPGSVVNISNTILANNSVVGAEFNDCAGRVFSGNNNLISTNVGCSFLTPASNDLVGADHAEIAANLGTLADNGGTVLTHLPSRLSPALQRGYASGGGTTCELTDARGIARPQEGRCDIGAVEVANPPAQSYPVTTTVDKLDGFTGGSCSLREAVMAANTKQTQGSCPAGAGGTVTNTIQLAPGTYTLSRSGANDDTNVNGDLDILPSGSGTVITGSGSGQVTIDANGMTTSDRAIHVRPGVLGGFISGVNIVNGNATGSGGGVQSEGELVMRSVTVRGNYAELGGGGVNYASGGSGVISNSTFSGNQTNGDGGGMRAAAGSSPSLNNVTVTGNTARAFGGPGLLGGGGLMGFAGSQIANTIVAGNADPLGVPDCAFTATPSQGHNLIGDATGCSFTGATGDQVGTGASPLPAGLGGLADNGGRTLTHSPLFGSPALNAGNPAAPTGSIPTCMTSDQLGGTRPLAGRCDIGAVEADPAAPPPTGGGGGTVTPPTTTTTAPKKCKKGFKLKNGKCKKKKKKRKRKK